MPNILKSLFKPPSTRSKRSTHPQPTPPEHITPTDTPARQGLNTQELEALADLLRREIQDNPDEAPEKKRRHLFSLLGTEGRDRDDKMKRLVELLEGMHADGGQERVDPYPPPTEGGGIESDRVQRAASMLRKSRKGGGGLQRELSRDTVVRSEISGDSSEGGGEWGKTMEACVAVLATSEKVLQSSVANSKTCRQVLDRIGSLLDAQREELLDIRPYTEAKRLPSLRTLKEIYLKSASGLQDIRGMKDRDAKSTLRTLVQVLQEGPDYLIDVIIIEAIIWQAEVIDSRFGGEIRVVLDKAVAEQADLATFRQAAESIIAISSALPREELDDEEGRDAYRSIGVLVKQLQIRVKSTGRHTPILTRGTPSSREALDPSKSSKSSRSSALIPSSSPMPSPSLSLPKSPAISPVSSRSASPSTDPAYENLNASDLQARYGTGTITPTQPPSLQPSGQATPSPAPLTPPTEDEPEVWEYCGNLLTRSALDLVLRQEALAMADSSGQYAVEVSWDDLRGAWIPNWAEKLNDVDVVDGHLPSTNPVDFRVKRKDAWGNAIGWRDGRMYYDEEPSFELRDD